MDQQQRHRKDGHRKEAFAKGRSHAYYDPLRCRTGTRTAARPERDEFDRFVALKFLLKSWR
jgi:hypothetical protein